MLAVILLVKCSVFEMLWLKNDIKQTKALFFVSVTDILVLTEVDGDRFSTVLSCNAIFKYQLLG